MEPGGNDRRDRGPEKGPSSPGSDSSPPPAALFDLAPVACFLVRGDGTIRSANRAAGALTGYRPEELRGLPFVALLSVECRPRATSLLGGAREGQAWDGEELVCLRRDGEELVGLLSGNPVGPPAVEPAEVSVAMVDITDRRHAEAREQQNARHLAFLAESAMAFMAFPVDGDLHRFAAERIRGVVGEPCLVAVSDYDDARETYRPKAVLGLGPQVEDILALLGRHPTDMDGDFTAVAKAHLATGRLVRLEGGVHALAGEVLNRFVAGAAERILGIRDIYLAGFVQHGVVYGGVVLVTRRGCPPVNEPLVEALAAQAAVAIGRRRSEERLRQTEERLRHSQRLEALGQLTGGVAHDFNNLICAISGAAELALDAVPEEDPVRLELATIKGAAERASALTRQLLAFSRKQALDPRVLDLNAEVRGLRKLLGRLIGEDLSLVTDLAPDLGRVLADPSQLDQVVINLVINARDAMPEGGTVVVATANVEVDTALARDVAGLMPGPHVLLSVTDTGTGMDETTRLRAFEPFFTTKEPGLGTGLGLSTVYGIVRQSGGAARILSEPGKGCRLEVYIPREDHSAAEEPAEQRPARPPGRRATVLVVEDEDMLRGLVTKMLERAGYETIAARHGIEALAVLESHDGPVDLLLTDVVMPELGGRRLGERCRALRPETAILYMSGYAEERPGGAGRLEADASFIGKPFGRAELLQKVAEVLAGGPPPTPR